MQPAAPPTLLLVPAVAVRAYERIRDALPGVEVHFAVKCQPHPALLGALAGAGAHFEVASAAEIEAVAGVGADPADVVFSHPVKTVADIHTARAAGVDLFAFDSVDELAKLVEHAPGAQVMVRMATRPAASDVPSEGKFGVDVRSAVTLLLAAAEAGQRPAGIAFHVGSQCLDPQAWVRAIDDAVWIMRELDRHGLRLDVLDIGGGFPAGYAAHPAPPEITVYGQTIRAALAKRLPYPVRVIAEPGRAIAAEAGTMRATVVGTARRHNRRWAHLDVGAFHGFIEALETNRGLRWPVADSRGDGVRDYWTLTGPSCDGQDTIVDDVLLSAELRRDDQVMIACAGAYTNAYTSGAFNGFPVPEVVELYDQAAGTAGRPGTGGEEDDADRSPQPASPAA